jgi:hypothetical protein
MSRKAAQQLAVDLAASRLATMGRRLPSSLRLISHKGLI